MGGATAGSGAPQQVAHIPAVDTNDLTDAPPPEILPDTHLAAGRLHESNGRLARAAEQYRLAVGARPDFVEAYNRLGIVLGRLGRFREAEEAFRRAVQLAPDQAHLYNNLAFNHIMQSRWNEAQAELTRALEIQPEFGRARVNLGMVLAQQEQFEAALEQFRTALKPEDAFYNIGLMYQSKQKPVEAARAYQAALEANPKLTAAQQRLEKLPIDAVNTARLLGALAFAPPPVAEATEPTVPGTIEPALAESHQPAGVETLEPVAQASDLTGQLSPITTRPALADPWDFDLFDAGLEQFTTVGLFVSDDESSAAQEPPLVGGEMDELALLDWDPFAAQRFSVEAEPPAPAAEPVPQAKESSDRHGESMTRFIDPQRLLQKVRSLRAPIERLIDRLSLNGQESAEMGSPAPQPIAEPEPAAQSMIEPRCFIGPAVQSDFEFIGPPDLSVGTPDSFIDTPNLSIDAPDFSVDQ
ncbi:MAG: hypothetical protein AMXMBFR13_09190 [Phycisphaerae bacterium]